MFTICIKLWCSFFCMHNKIQCSFMSSPYCSLAWKKKKHVKILYLLALNWDFADFQNAANPICSFFVRLYSLPFYQSGKQVDLLWLIPFLLSTCQHEVALVCKTWISEYYSVCTVYSATSLKIVFDQVYSQSVQESNNFSNLSNRFFVGVWRDHFAFCDTVSIIHVSPIYFDSVPHS